MKRLFLLAISCALLCLQCRAAAPGEFFPSMFRIEASGLPSIDVPAVMNIGSESEVVEVRRPSPNPGQESIVKTPGRLYWLDISFKRSLSQDQALWEWRRFVEKGDMLKARKNLKISLLDQNGKAFATWQFVNAWPSAISVGADFTETVRIVHEGMSRLAN